MFKQCDKRLVLAKREGRNLDILESAYQCYFHVKVINNAFEYCSGQWKLNECKTLCKILKNNSAKHLNSVCAI